MVSMNKGLIIGLLTPLTYITLQEHAARWTRIMMYTDGARLVPVSSLSVQCWGQVVVGWLLNVSATDLLRQFYVLPH